MVATVALRPGRWTPIPGTRCEVRWDGEEELTIWRHNGVWDLSPASRPGRVMAWVRVARDGGPVTPEWPIVPIGAPAIYRSGAAGDTPDRRRL